MIAICDDVLFIVLPIFVFFYFFISLETAKTQRAKTESDNPPPACAQFILSVQLTHYRFLQEFSRQALIDDGAQSVDCRVRGSAAVRWK